MNKKAIALYSGGLDSTVLVYYLRATGYAVRLVSVDYGQRHRRELESAQAIAFLNHWPWDVIDLKSITELISSSVLTGKGHVPHGNYAEENMKQTVVPNRNAMMLALAYAVAVGQEAQVVATAVHAGDHFIYPDCRPEFVRVLDKAFHLGNEGFGDPNLAIVTPFIRLSKAQIVRLGEELGVPFERTWSCYEGHRIHCGQCGTCVERLEAFDIAGVVDPTEYVNTDYWRTVTGR